MSLRRDATDAVARLGRASGDDIMAEFPGYTRAQVFQALKNAHSCGWLDIVESAGLGCRVPNVYTPGTGKKPELRKPVADYPLSFIFDAGERIEQGRPFWKARVPRADFSTAEAAE